jgi:Rho GDP-dissociation inhibitor
MSSAVEVAISCSKTVDIAAAAPEEAAKDRAVVPEHGNGDCAAAAATNGKKCAEAAAAHCRKAEEEEDDEDGEKVPEHIDLGPILSIKDQLEKDKVLPRFATYRTRILLSSCYSCNRIYCRGCRSIDECVVRVLDSQDDESLRRWKEQLLGSVDLNSVGGKPLQPRTQLQFRSLLPFNSDRRPCA